MGAPNDLTNQANTSANPQNGMSQEQAVEVVRGFYDDAAETARQIRASGFQGSIGYLVDINGTIYNGRNDKRIRAHLELMHTQGNIHIDLVSGETQPSQLDRLSAVHGSDIREALLSNHENPIILNKIGFTTLIRTGKLNPAIYLDDIPSQGGDSAFNKTVFEAVICHLEGKGKAGGKYYNSLGEEIDRLLDACDVLSDEDILHEARNFIEAVKQKNFQPKLDGPAGGDQPL